MTATRHAAPAVFELPDDGRVRVVIEDITPRVDGGRYAIKRVVGEAVDVEADAYADGHDCIGVQLLYRRHGAPRWQARMMEAIGNDRWRARFTPDALGRWQYTVRAWVDHLASWRRDIVKRHAAGQDLAAEWQRGAALLAATAARSGDQRLADQARALSDARRDDAHRLALATAAGLAQRAVLHPDPLTVARAPQAFAVIVDPPRAGFSAWYELFPRSASPDPARHGTLRDVIDRLPEIAKMGFDVLYLPPIHPIGRRHRKGPNNRTQAGPDDPGSPWAIGAAEGGHQAIHPALGTLDDFRDLLAATGRLGIDVALDLAFQCSPDHPYVTAHPAWFLHRPDGSIRYAENPPKQYQDIYPFDFESTDWRALWAELHRVVAFWIAAGVRVFRVDNPHTKPFGFWAWLIADLKRTHPELIFLSEAFTRPKPMHRLAKAGFTQSYTYFTWRNGKHEITDYFSALTHGEARDYFRANLWPNTPDILPENLQYSGRAGFMLRVTLAATLGANYGIYGPAFELMERTACEPGAEEYLDSEKYQQRHWDTGREDSLCAYLAHLNRVRRDNPALHSDRALRFHRVDNDALLCYSKSTPEHDNCILCVANLDVHHRQAGWLDLDLAALGIDADAPYQAQDLLSGARFLWQGPRNFVALDPTQAPAHVLRLRRRVRSERDFDYFL